jgi:DNA polymerase-3 subunit delta'
MALYPDAALKYLHRAEAQQRLAHAYLISGPAGSGKRDLAIRFASEINGVPAEGVFTSPMSGVIVVEPESKSRRIIVEQIRNLEHSLQMRGIDGRRKVVVISDADRMQPQAANAFLKTLEEPPNDSLLLLLTAMPEALPDTIVSRCLAVTLAAPSEREESAEEKELLELLCDLAASRSSGVELAYRASQGIQRLLQGVRDEIAEQMATSQKAEELRYKNATDGVWLDSRENYYKAMTESAYLERRSRLIETLFLWWGDVLRGSTGLPPRHLTSCSNATAQFAVNLSAPEILRRLRRLEELRDHLSRTIQETLAIEVACLELFAG